MSENSNSSLEPVVCQLIHGFISCFIFHYKQRTRHHSMILVETGGHDTLPQKVYIMCSLKQMFVIANTMLNDGPLPSNYQIRLINNMVNINFNQCFFFTLKMSAHFFPSISRCGQWPFSLWPFPVSCLHIITLNYLFRGTQVQISMLLI